MLISFRASNSMDVTISLYSVNGTDKSVGHEPRAHTRQASVSGRTNRVDIIYANYGTRALDSLTAR